jgi:predicted small lipoprotein YifL
MGALAAALALGGCGRKGALDAPPGGASAVSQTDQAGGQQQSSQGGNVIERGGAGSLPRIPLDALLN